MIELLDYFITERENIRIERSKGHAAPWTDDPILQTYHFCNIRREDDRGTKEIAEVWRTPYSEHPKIHAIMAAARLFNHAPTLRAIPHPLEDWRPIVKKYRADGNKVFHTAYVVTTNGEHLDKVDYAYRITQEVAAVPIYDTCRATFESLCTVRGIGTFLAAQIIADLKRTEALCEAPDREVFVAHGPGSMKGANHILRTTRSTFNSSIEDIRDTLVAMGNPHISGIDNQDLQNCLCEFSKYVRYLNKSKGRIRHYWGGTV